MDMAERAKEFRSMVLENRKISNENAATIQTHKDEIDAKFDDLYSMTDALFETPSIPPSGKELLEETGLNMNPGGYALTAIEAAVDTSGNAEKCPRGVYVINAPPDICTRRTEDGTGYVCDTQGRASNGDVCLLGFSKSGVTATFAQETSSTALEISAAGFCLNVPGKDILHINGDPYKCTLPTETGT